MTTQTVGENIRMHVLRLANGRCAMCGRTETAHGVVTHLNHKIPPYLGGVTKLENLWAICTQCRDGRKQFLGSLASPENMRAMNHSQVHIRSGEALKAAKGKPISADVLHVIANQDDWKKRLRELRYLNWEIKARSAKNENGRIVSFYRLLKSEPWPEDPTGLIR